MNPKNHEEHIRHSFDSYCKKILKNKTLDLQRRTKWQREREISFSELTAQELAELSVTDKYSYEYDFTVLGESVGITNADLADALNELPQELRDIILMSYFFDMTDKEIAEHLHMARRTVAYQRVNTLKKLKNLMKDEDL